ncbi:unnamed protein product [Sphagnum jensenii]|uniref:TF-B3 domain-containing protein n=1 Tax=Sphagnum jensenii TaxID=128206 RepID=A0ABP0W126_9BRYO
MKKSNVYQNFIVKIPPAFRQAHIPCEVTDLKLQDAVGQQTHAFLSGEVLTGGWQQFSLHHLLEEGDTCVFELITNKTEDLTFTVHIFHVVEVDHSKVQWQDHYMILSRGDLGQTYDSGKIKPFKSFKNRFPIPYQASNNTSLLWYSIKRGSAHIIVLSSYSAYGEEQ